MCLSSICSKATEEDRSVVEDSQSNKEQAVTSEASTHCCADSPLPSNDESTTMAGVMVEEEKEVVDNSHSDDAPRYADASFEESRDFSVSATEQHGTCARGDTEERKSDGEDRNAYKEIGDIYQEMVLEIKENDENMWEEVSEEGSEVVADIKSKEKMQEGSKEQDIAICRTSSEIWDGLEDVICEVMEEEESKQIEKKGARESVAGEGNMIQHANTGEREEQIKVSEEKTLKVDEGGAKEAEVRIEIVKESTETTEEKLPDKDMQQECEEKETNLTKTKELDEAIQGKHAINDETQHRGREEVASTDKDKERADEPRRNPQSIDLVRSDMKELKEGRKCEESDSNQGGVGRKLVISKHPKVYQAKAVPVVPPKPQHCRITALTLRQQQQQRDADTGRENSQKVPTEQDTVCGGEQGRDGDEGKGIKEKPTLRGGEKERERRRDGDDNATRDTSRNSPLSMCFDEAVAIATMRREKEKECEKERHREWGNEVQ